VTVDSAGLGHEVVNGRICVRYLGKEGVYGAPMPAAEIPEWYWTSPPNDITAERVGIWRQLREEG
jgi:hypothetical protein